jgi:hypothetical protein
MLLLMTKWKAETPEVQVRKAGEYMIEQYKKNGIGFPPL